MQVSPLPFVSTWYVMWSVFNNHVCFYFLDFNLLNWYLSLDSLMRSSPTATRTRWVSRTSPLYLDQISFDPRWRTQSLSWKVQRVVTDVMTEFMVKKKKKNHCKGTGKSINNSTPRCYLNIKWHLVVLQHCITVVCQIVTKYKLRNINRIRVHEHTFCRDSQHSYLTCLHNISFTEWNIYKLHWSKKVQDRDTRIQGLNLTIKYF